MRYSYSPEQDFSDWETERLVAYRNDLASTKDRRNRAIKRRVEQVIKYRPSEEVDMYKLTEKSKEILKGFLEGKKTISGTSNYGNTLIHIGENNSLYITVINNHGENIRFLVDKNMTIEIQDVPRLGDRVGYPFLDPNFSINSVLLSFEDQVKILSRRKKK